MTDLSPGARVDALAWASAGDIAAAVTSGKASAAAVIEAALARIAAHDRALNSFTAIVDDRARVTARTIDAARARGEPLRPLAGVPFAVKNLFAVAGLSAPARP